MVLSRLALVLVLLLLTGGCRSAPPPELPLSPSTSESVEAMPTRSPGCRDLLDGADTATVEGRFQIVAATVDAVRWGVCDPIEPDARVCRSLFLIAATDPLVAIGAGLTGAAVEQLIEQHVWALAEGRNAAEASGDLALGHALERLSAVVIDGGDARLAAVAVERAAPEIVEPIAQAEVTCAAVPQ